MLMNDMSFQLLLGSSVANLAILLLNLATFQTILSTFSYEST